MIFCITDMIFGKEKKEKKKAEKSLLTQATAAASALKNTKEVISLFPTTKTAADQNDDIDKIILQGVTNK